MKLKLAILLLLLGYSCQHDIRNRNSGVEDRTNPEVSDTTRQQRTTAEYIGDSSLCAQYRTQFVHYKEVFDTLLSNPMNGVKIQSELAFTRSINDCQFGDLYYHSWELTLANGMLIQFIENSNNSKNRLLTFVGNDLFSVRKLLGEMYERDSEINFHYDSGKLYLLTNGNFLYVEQPASWCGTANKFDFYQYFDLANKNLIQFVEKDTFIEKLKKRHAN